MKPLSRRVFDKTPAYIVTALFAALIMTDRQPATAVRAAQTMDWPAVTRETMPWTRWWWMGSAVDAPGLTADLEALRRAGIGGVEITPIYGAMGAEPRFVSYLSDEWVRLLEHTLREAGRLGMGVDVATGTGWPFGGPWVTGTDASRTLAHRSWTVDGGQRLSEPVRLEQPALVSAIGARGIRIADLQDPVHKNPNLQALALEQVRYPQALPLVTLVAQSRDGITADLTARVAADGTLDWDAPPGSWVLHGVFLGWHGKLVERAAPGGEGNVIDHFSRGAIRHYLERFDRAFAGHSLTGLRAFFNDSYEVDDARGQADGTPALFDEFQRRRGYDLRQHLTALFGSGTGDTDARVVADYRQTISDLLLDTFTTEWRAWAKQKGAVVRNQAHGSPASLLDLYAASDIPETEGTEIQRSKWATSAAHVAGRRLVSAEAATWLDEHFRTTLGQVRAAVDRFFIAGVNHIVYHGTAYSPADLKVGTTESPGSAGLQASPTESPGSAGLQASPTESPGSAGLQASPTKSSGSAGLQASPAPWPGWQFYASVEFNPRNSWWNDFAALNRYVTRVQSFLQAGRPDQDVLVYYPFYDSLAVRGPELLKHFGGTNPPAEGTAFEIASEALQKRGFTYDFISDRQLVATRVANGAISTTPETRARGFRPETDSRGSRLQAEGSYRTIVLPASKFIPIETFEKILLLVRNGATVVAFKGLPADVSGLADLDRRRVSFTRLRDQIRFGPADASGVREARLGRGAILTGDDLEPLLARARVRRESLVDLGLEYTRRQYDGGRYYFVVNTSDRDVDAWLPLNDVRRAAVVFDPMSGRKRVARVRRAADRLEAEVTLPRGSSVVVATTDVPGAAPSPVWEATGPPVEVPGPWTVRFAAGGPELPAPRTIERLASWTTFGGDAVQRFSGTAVYTATFPRSGGADAFALDLGQVRESARVELNGRDLGTLIGPSFKLTVERSQLAADNTLAIHVSNLMANRIAALDKAGVVWRIFYNVNFPARLPENRGPDGLFSAANWAPLDSGLLGPVTMTPLSARK